MINKETIPTREHTDFLKSGGVLGKLIRDKDWSATSVGNAETWSASVRTAVSLCLTSRFPIILWLGPDLNILYNDAYVPLLGERKHPTVLGAPGRQAWSEIWDTIGPLLESAMHGNATWNEDLQFFFARNLPEEEAYVTFSYSPILSANGQMVEGVFCACTETTLRVVCQRRLSTLRNLGLRRSQQYTVAAACRQGIEVLEANPLDIAFASIYLVDKDRTAATCIARTRQPADALQAFPLSHGLSDDDGPWPLATATRTGRNVDVADLPARIGQFTAPLWPDLVKTAVVLPLWTPRKATATGFLVVGISPRRIFDADYGSFLDLVAEHIGSAIAEAHVFEEERRRGLG